MPYVESPPESPSPDKKVRKLVLCFDGTGNTFQGNTSDTNVVKIYDKLDRNDENQYHYYQPGIGTYDISGGSLNKGAIGNITSKISRSIDSAIATSFDAHVMAGYKFLMNYHEPGAKIYMIGFSRGAFTARFLARMINKIGLLSRGNDEMIPFAYSLYQEYEQAKDEKLEDEAKRKLKLNNFTSTFCRKERSYHPGDGKVCYDAVKVYFLGIFDCVSSVSVLETPFGKTPKPVSVVGTAEHVRHAVAVDEFRVKFKAALLNQDKTKEEDTEDQHLNNEDIQELLVPGNHGDIGDLNDDDIREVWFPGNHGDVGGGWPAHGLETEEVPLGWWKNFTAKVGVILRGDKDDTATKVLDNAYQMSDYPLSWMIRELQLIGAKEEAYALKWGDHLQTFKKNFEPTEARKASRHNTMAFGRGSSLLKVLMWKFMDYVPLFPRYELEHSKWVLRTLPANMASARDIPKNALLHASLLHRLDGETREIGYEPKNNHGSGEPTEPCLKADKFIKIVEKPAEIDIKDANAKYPKVDHTLYALYPEAVTNYKSDAARIAGIKEAKFRKAHAQVVQ